MAWSYKLCKCATDVAEPSIVRIKENLNQAYKRSSTKLSFFCNVVILQTT